MSEKPHKGRIENWRKSPCESGLGYFITGKFIDHPSLHGEYGHTSFVVAHDEATGEIETNNSLYTLALQSAPQLKQKNQTLEIPAFMRDRILVVKCWSGYNYHPYCIAERFWSDSDPNYQRFQDPALLQPEKLKGSVCGQCREAIVPGDDTQERREYERLKAKYDR